MICYLATYPRSGNSLLQQLIIEGLRRLPAQVKAGGQANQYGEKWRVKPTPAAIAWRSEVIWDERTAVYSSVNQTLRLILPGPLDYLTEDRRRAFAAEDDVFFLKLHDRPFDRYFPGERVIQVMRHPGAVLWSYFRYLVDFELRKNGDHVFDSPPPSLDHIIDGDAPFGDWSAHCTAWADVSAPRLTLQYEDLTGDPTAMIARVSEFVGLPVHGHEFTDFKTYALRYRANDLRGKSEGYERFYTKDQLARLNERHGEVMGSLGYQLADTSLGQDSEQMARMQAILDVAWPWGARFDRERRAHSRKLKAMIAAKGA